MDTRVSIAVAALAGLAFASSEATLQCLSLLMVPIACSLPGARAIASVTAFYAAAALPTLWVVQTYTGSEVQAVAAYVALVAINAVVLGIAYAQRWLPRWIALPAALTALCVPPISGINPLGLAPLAGWLFPGFGLYGLLCLAVLVAGLSARPGLRFPSVAALLAVVVPIGTANATNALNSSSVVQGISIERSYDQRLNPAVMRLAYRHAELELVAASRAAIAVLPESVFGEWSTLDGEILSALPGHVYGGARRFIDDDHTVNAIVDAKSGETVYEQRNPPPLSRADGPQAIAGRGVLRDVGFATLICYELTNPWLTVQSFRSTENAIVWTSNLGWFDSPYLERRLRSVLTAWGRLFDRETTGAVIRHG